MLSIFAIATLATFASAQTTVDDVICPSGQFRAFLNGSNSALCLCVPPNNFHEGYPPINESCEVPDSQFIEPRVNTTPGTPVAGVTSRNNVDCNFERSCLYKGTQFQCLFDDRKLIQSCTRDGATAQVPFNKFTECAKKHKCTSRECATNCAYRTATCPQIFLPVCGENGQTYPNECILWSYRLNKVHDGPCAA